MKLTRHLYPDYVVLYYNVLKRCRENHSMFDITDKNYICRKDKCYFNYNCCKHLYEIDLRDVINNEI